MPEVRPVDKIKAGIRLQAGDGLYLLQKMPLGELMRYAHQCRLGHHPDDKVTFVFDTNPNYTNVCETTCTFCAFWRSEKSREAYTLSPDEVAERVDKAWQAGATTVLLQGGHNPNIRLEDFIRYIRAIQKSTPEIHIHPFSPSEIIYMAETENILTTELLQSLWREGIRTIPGGGAEILSERVRKLISPKKNSSDRWLSVMEEAQQMGFKTTATMMYGHEESDKEIVEHLLRLRTLQDRTSGFSSFIPWSFKPGNSLLGKKIRQSAPSIKYLRIISTARLLLDNFTHIQSSWFSEDKKTGQLGLIAGADDFGGLLFEENVLKNANHAPKTSFDSTLETIRQSGFVPVQRNTHYKIIQEY